MTNQKYFLALIVIIAATVGSLFLAHRNAVVVVPQQSTQDGAMVSTSSTPDGFEVNPAPAPPPDAHAQAKNSYIIPVSAHETVLDAMRAYASSSDFSFTGQDYPSLGFFVDSIDGKQNGNGMYWFLYINGTSSALGASSAEVVPGDTVEWRFKTN